MQYQVSRVLAGPFLRLLWRPEITGLEHIPASGGAILASNHLSIVDSVFLPLMLPRPVTFAAKSEYFTGTRPVDRLTGAYLRATKQLSVDRAGARAAQDMLESALRLMRGGALFGIYRRAPGHRTGGCTAAGPGSAGWRSARPAGDPGGDDRDRPVLPPGSKIPG